MIIQRFLSIFFPEFIFRIPTHEKKIFLTFDDGPTPEITPWVLTELKKHNALATFFCIGENVKKHPDIFSEIVRGGHTAGNHTMHHLNGWKTSTANYLVEVKLCEEVMGIYSQEAKSKKQKARFFRPPYGRITPLQYSSLKKNHRIVMWDVLSKDYDSTISAEECMQRVITKSKPGAVVVFHDSKKAEINLRYALPRILEYFSQRGFCFSSLN